MPPSTIEVVIRLVLVWSILLTSLPPALAWAAPAGQQPTEEASSVEATAEPTEETQPPDQNPTPAEPTQEPATPETPPATEPVEPTAAPSVTEEPTSPPTGEASPTGEPTLPPTEETPPTAEPTEEGSPTATTEPTLKPASPTPITPTATATSVLTPTATATLTPTVVATPTLSSKPTFYLTMQVEPPLVQPGDPLTVTLTLSNPAQVKVDNLVISATLPAEIAYQQPLGSVTPGYNPLARLLTWKIPPDTSSQAGQRLGFVGQIVPGALPASLSLVAEIADPAVDGQSTASAALIIVAGPTATPIATVEPPGPPAVVDMGIQSEAPEQGQPRDNHWVAVSVTDAEGRAVADGTQVELQMQNGRLEKTDLRTKDGIVTTRFKLPSGQTGQITARVDGLEATRQWPETEVEQLTQSQRLINHVLQRPDNGYSEATQAIAGARNRLKGAQDDAGAESRTREVVFKPDSLTYRLKQQEPPTTTVKSRQRDLPKQEVGFQLTDLRVGAQSLLSGRPDMVHSDNWVIYSDPAQPWQMVYELNEEILAQYFLFPEELPEGDLVIEGRFQTNLKPVLLSEEEGIVFEGPAARQPETQLGYGAALIKDSAGRSRRVEMVLDGKKLRLTVPGQWLRNAQYPVVIDPLIGPAELVSGLQGEAYNPQVAYNPDDDEYLTVWDWNGDIYGQRLDDNGEPVGEVITISQAQGTQQKADVIYNPVSQDYLVVWRDQRYGSPYYLAYAQRVNANGTLQGPEIAVTTPLQYLGYFGGVRAAVADTGDSLVVWSHYDNSTNYNVYGQLIESDGDLSGSPIAISGSVTKEQYAPAVAYDGQTDQFLVVWVDKRDGSEYDVYGQRLDDSGTLTGSATVIENLSGQNASYPAIAADNSSEFLVTWHENISSSDYDIFARRVDVSSGIQIGSRLSIEDSSGKDIYPDVTALSTGDYLVAYAENDYKISLRRVDSSGVSNLLSDIDKGYRPALAAGSSGEALAVWEDLQTSEQRLITGQLIDGDATGQPATLGDLLFISPYYSIRDNPSLTYDSTANRYLLAWDQADAGPQKDIFVQPLDDQGQPLTTPLNITNIPTATQFSPHIAAGDTGYLVAWQDQREITTNDTDIYARLLDQNGQPTGSEILLAQVSGDQWVPYVIYNDARDEYLVAWEDLRNGDKEIFYQIVEPDGSLSLNPVGQLALSGDQGYPHIALNPTTGQYLVIFHHTDTGTNNSDTYGHFINGDGTPSGTLFMVSNASGDQFNSSLAYSQTADRFLAVWSDRRNGYSNSDVYGQIISGTGASLIGNEIAIATASQQQETPVVVARTGDSLSEFVVTWSDQRNDSDRDIYLQRLNGDGQLLDEPDTITVETSSTVNLPVAVDSANYFANPDVVYNPTDQVYLMVWNNIDDGGVYAQRYTSSIPPAPGASFSRDPSTGVVPLTVTFTDTSTGTIAGRTWAFGDGGLAYAGSATQVEHTYLTTGTFSVGLTTTNPGGSTTATELVTVTEQITPNLTEDFEGWDIDDDPTFWLDQANDTSALDEFEVGWVPADSGSGQNRVLSTDYTNSWAYSSYAIPGWSSWQNYEVSGRMRLTDPAGSVGVTVYSRYPAGEAAWYALRSQGGGSAFELAAGGTTLTGLPTITQTVQADTWYRFRVQVATLSDRVSLQAKVWLDGQTEPGSWQAVAEDTSANRITAGAVGMRSWGAGAKYIDDVVVAPLSTELQAGFTAFPTDGPAPLAVLFFPNQLSADTYLWHFGDGLTSTLTSPSHTYTQAGLYTVSLQVEKGGESQALTRTNYITVSPEPVPELVRAFAFGADTWTRATANEPSVDYTKVTQGGQNFTYSVGQGHGYTNTTDLDTTPNNRGVYSGDDEIYDQFIGARNSGQIVFRIDLPNGRYRFVAAGGDALYGNHSTTIQVQDGAAGQTLTLVSDYVQSTAGYFWTVDFGDKSVPPADGLSSDPIFVAQSDSDILEVTQGYIQVIQQVGAGGQTSGGDLSLLEVWELVEAQPGLTISKSAPTTVLPGEPITYTLTITNSSAATATNLLITDTLPISANYVSGGSLAGGVVSWTVPSLTGGQAISVTFSVTATETITNSDYQVTANDGVSAVGQDEIVTVMSAPQVIADFSAFPTSGTAPLMVQFLNNSSGASSYLWAFGDGITSTIASPTHTYTVADVYTVTLTADNGSASDTATHLITVTHSANLTITKTGPSTALAGAPITYTLTVSNSGSVTATNLLITDTVPTNAYYNGTQATGSEVVSWTVPSLAGGEAISVTFSVTTTETITNSDYGVTADGGVSAVGQQIVTTTVSPPLSIDFTASPVSGTSPLTVTFIATTTASTHLWRFGDGYTQTLTNSTIITESAALTTTHTYTEAGVFTVTLTAGNGTITETLTKTNYITVINPGIPITPTGLIWWDDGFFFRQPLVITGPVAYSSGVTTVLEATLDTTTLIASEKLRSDGYDLRVLYWDESALTWSQLPRAVSGLNTVTTTVRFPLQATITDTTVSYYLYYGNWIADAPPLLSGSQTPANVTISALAEEDAEVSATLQTGQSGEQILVSADGRVQIRVPSSAVTQELVVTHTPYRPRVYQGDNHLKRFSLTFADTNGTPISQFSDDIIITLDYDGLGVPAGSEDDVTVLLQTGSSLTTLSTASSNNVAQATLSNPAGEEALQIRRLDYTGEPPSIEDASLTPDDTDLFTGGATYGFSLPVPPGTAGVQPDLSLGYSSRVAQDSRSLQAGVVGWGFDLNVPFVGRTTQNKLLRTSTEVQQDDYYLVLGGVSSQLISEGGNAYRLQRDNRWKIERQSDRTCPFAADLDCDYWVVTTQDGMAYRFGYEVEALQRSLAYESGQIKTYPGTFWLDQIQDPHGNTITFAYDDNEKTTFDYVVNNTPYDAAMYLTAIDYTSNTSTGLAAQRHVSLSYTDRDINGVRDDDDTSACQATLCDLRSKRLDAVETSVSGQRAARYEFEYDYLLGQGQPKLVLETIKTLGETSGDTLPDTALTYYGLGTTEQGLLHTVDNGYGAVMSYEYKTAGSSAQLYISKRTASVDSQDRVVTYDYTGFQDDQPGLVDVTRPDGSVVETTYFLDEDRRGHPEFVRIYTDTARTNLAQETETAYRVADTVGTSATFVAVDTVTQTVDAKSIRTRYDYDIATGNVTEVVEEGDLARSDDNRRTVTEYAGDDDDRIVNRPKRVTLYSASSGGSAVTQAEYYYDDHTSLDTAPTLGDLTKQVQKGLNGASDLAVSYGYDIYGNVTSVIDGRGNQTTTLYDAIYKTFAHVVTQPALNSLIFQTTTLYDARWGVPTQVTDVNNQTTTYTYDGFGRPDITTDPLSTTIKYTYTDNAGGREVQTVLAYQQPEAYTTKTHSNGLGEVTREERDGDSGTIIITRSYDTMGRLEAVSAPHFSGETVVNTQYEYDALGRITQVTNTDNTVQTLTYENWDTVTRIDENGHQTKRYSDGLGRLREVHVFTGTTTPILYSKTKYSYDAKDALNTVVHTDPLDSPLASAVSLTINSLGQKTVMNDPDMGMWQYTYDAAGNLESQTDAIGQVITFTYDTHNRVTAKQYSDGSPAVSYSYDAGSYGLGRRTGMTDGSGSSAWVYDPLGRVLTETKVISGFEEAFPTGYTYDRLDRLKTLTYPDGETVTYGYNDQNLVESLTSSLGDTYLSSASYSALDQPTVLSLGNGVTTNYSYYTPASGPAHFRLQTLQTSQGGVSLQDLSYTYDDGGNIETVDDAATSTSWEYFYDPLDRLTEAGLTKPGTGLDEGGNPIQDNSTFEYQYDRLGNLTYRYDEAAEVELSLAYPTTGSARPHAPTTITDNLNGGSVLASFTYDNNGNRTVDTERGLTYTFDSDNRLVQVTGQGTTDFTYDGDGQRTQRTVDDDEEDSTIYIGDYFETTAGDRWGEAQLIFGATSEDQWWPQVVSDEADQLYLVWLEAENNAGQLHFAMYDPSVNAWSTPETIPTSVQQFNGDQDGILPSMAVAPTGEVYVAWQEFVSNSDGIWVYRRTTGGAWSQDFSINQSLYAETKPSLTIAPDGTVYLAWQNEDDGTIQIRRRTSGGSWATEPTIPQDNGYSAQYPALAADSQSNIFLVYKQDDLHLTRRDALSSTWATDPNASGSVDGRIEVAIGPDDSLYMVWEEDTLRRNADGTWEDTGNGLGNWTRGFDMIVDPFGQYHVIEDDSTDTSGDDRQIFVDNVEILPDPPAGRSTIIFPYFPTLTVGEAGKLTAIWQAEPLEGDPARLYISINQPQVTKHYFANGQRLATRVDNALYYIHGDHLGSTTLLTDQNGNEVNRIEYAPYGSIITSTGPLATDRLFTGQRFESSLDLYDYRARFYDPLAGSFISPDSIVPEPTSSSGFNRYRYARNNPLMYTDPTGHFECAGVYRCSKKSHSSAHARIFYMNGINWNTFNNIEPKEYGGEYESILYTLNEAFGAENVTPIPVFNSGYNGSVDSRIAIFAEAWGWKKPYANRIANAVEQSLDPVPLGPDEKLVLVGSSAGGTAAIEALDILENKGIYVDQVILRSSFVGEWWLSNVGQVDYLATDPPWIDTWNYSRESWAPDGISVNEYTVPGLDDHSPSRATNPGAAQNTINELIVNLIGN